MAIIELHPIGGDVSNFNGAAFPSAPSRVRPYFLAQRRPLYNRPTGTGAESVRRAVAVVRGARPITQMSRISQRDRPAVAGRLRFAHITRCLPIVSHHIAETRRAHNASLGAMNAAARGSIPAAASIPPLRWESPSGRRRRVSRATKACRVPPFKTAFRAVYQAALTRQRTAHRAIIQFRSLTAGQRKKLLRPI